MSERVYSVAIDGLSVYQTPEADASPLTTLGQNQLVARLDLFDYQGRWCVFADTPGNGAFVGYVDKIGLSTLSGEFLPIEEVGEKTDQSPDSTIKPEPNAQDAEASTNNEVKTAPSDGVESTSQTAIQYDTERADPANLEKGYFNAHNQVATPLTEEKFRAACARLPNVPPEHLWAFLMLGVNYCGFDDQRRPRIRFERDAFSHFTRSQFDRDYPDISATSAYKYTSDVFPEERYGNLGHQFKKLERAASLHKSAALKGTSWGLGQVFGYMFDQVGYKTLDEFVAAMGASEDNQVDAIVDLLIAMEAVEALAQGDWQLLFQITKNGKFRTPGALDELKKHEDRFPKVDLLLRQLQVYLDYLNYYKSGNDGLWGGNSRNAVKAFASDASLSHLIPKFEKPENEVLRTLIEAARSEVYQLGPGWSLVQDAETLEKPDASKTLANTVTLGCHDANVSHDQCAAYFDRVRSLTSLTAPENVTRTNTFSQSQLPAASASEMSVARIQEILKQLGFYQGGKIDGICGYRTTSAIRLMQEYSRTLRGETNVIPDGVYGPNTHRSLMNWLREDSSPEANWNKIGPEYDQWLGLLREIRGYKQASPDFWSKRVLSYTARTATRKPLDWITTGYDNMHLIGVRRNDTPGRFDDVFILLINGLVFKFQGSTQAGLPDIKNTKQHAPHLLPGQHQYHFGWHRQQYPALKPGAGGVLIVRSGEDNILSEAEKSGPLESNTTINIHWAGLGGSKVVSNWSEGCQVITGSYYLNPGQQLIECADFAASGNKALNAGYASSRGAYSLLVDLITTQSAQLSTNEVSYTLLTPEDFSRAPENGEPTLGYLHSAIALVESRVK